MWSILTVLSLAVVALAHPDIGLQIRQSQYGTPSGSYIPTGSTAFHNHENSGHDNHGYSSHQQGAISNSNYNGGASVHRSDLGGFGSQSKSFTYNNNNGGFGNNKYNNNQGFQSGSSGSISGLNSASNGFHGSSSRFVDQTGGAPIVNKQSYFYDAPEIHETSQLRIHSQAAAAHHNYKLIFVKAPAYHAPQVPRIPTHEQNEERTRVYVLVKKQDSIQDIVIPTNAPSKQSKPEVFFIKYKTQKEAEDQIHSIEQGASSGISALAVNSDSELIRNIQDTKETSLNSGFDQRDFHSSNINTVGRGNDYGRNHGGHTNGGVNHGDNFNYQGSTSSNSFVSSNNANRNNFGPAGASGPY